MAISVKHAAGVLFSVARRLTLGKSCQTQLLQASRTVASSSSSDSGSESGSSSSDDESTKPSNKLNLTKAAGRNTAKGDEHQSLTSDQNVEGIDAAVDQKLVTAARTVAESLGGNVVETQSDLLKQLQEHAATTEAQKATGPLSAMSMLKGMKIDHGSPKTGGFGGRREGFEGHRRFDGEGDQQRPARRGEERFRRPSRPRQDLKDLPKLFDGPSLGVFSQRLATSGTEKSDISDVMIRLQSKGTEATLRYFSSLTQSSGTEAEGSTLRQPSLFDIAAAEQLEKLRTQVPDNAYEEMIEWTKEGKLWTFPVNNEIGMHEETKVSFHEHIFLEPLIADFPKKGPLRHFMELVITGLSKNPHLSVEQKREHVQWYRDYFADKKAVIDEALSPPPAAAAAAAGSLEGEQPSQ